MTSSYTAFWSISCAASAPLPRAVLVGWSEGQKLRFYQLAWQLSLHPFPFHSGDLGSICPLTGRYFEERILNVLEPSLSSVHFYRKVRTSPGHRAAGTLLRRSHNPERSAMILEHPPQRHARKMPELQIGRQRLVRR
jgi:hypothetical protein